MVEAIKYNLSNLTNFNGRDARQTFWFYVLFLVIVQYALGLLVSAPMMGGVMQGAITGVRDGLSETEMQARMMAQITGPMRTAMLFSAGLTLICALFLAAAFVRRLHDSGRPGWIAAIAFICKLAALSASIANIDNVVDAMAKSGTGNPVAVFQAQGSLVYLTMLSWAGMLIVIVFGAWPSTDGANRYGDEPVRF